jgi:hypothetical protein
VPERSDGWRQDCVLLHFASDQQRAFDCARLGDHRRAAPWSGYASNVNVESDLRNQIFALQKCSQAVYVPSSNSDLYQFGFKPTKQESQPFPNLFANEQFSQFNPNPENVGHDVFYNSTRQQLKDAGDIMFPNKNGGCVTETTKTKTENKTDVKNKK